MNFDFGWMEGSELLWFLVFALIVFRVLDHFQYRVRRHSDKTTDARVGLIRAPHEVKRKWFG